MFRRRTLKDVFTPNTIAKLTYVQREKIENDLKSNLEIPGKQIIIYGNSGSGKTTLVRKMLSDCKLNFVHMHCQSSTTFDDILLNTFDDLNRFYISERTSNSSRSIESGLKAEYSAIAADLMVRKSTSEDQTYTRIIPPRLTPQKLAKFLGEVKAIWLIEDFHKVEQSEKQKIADVLKIFIDASNDFPNVKIICIGAVGSARELVQLDSNLYPRVTELYVPLLNEEEIKTIIHRGCKLLNISMAKDLKNKITYYSNHLAALAHQMCYDICSANHINKRQIKHKTINERFFKDAVASYVNKNSDTLKGIYDSCTKDSLAWYILKTFASTNKDVLKFLEIKRKVCAKKRQFNDNEIKTKLQELSSPDINIIRYDINIDTYSISTPFWGAFLKMQLALEKSNKIDKNVFFLKNQDDFDADVYDVILDQLHQLQISI